MEVNQRGCFELRLELGLVVETIEVTGVAPLSNIDTPLVSRNVISLTLLAPGVTTSNPAAVNHGVRRSGGGRSYVNGGRKEANDFLPPTTSRPTSPSRTPSRRSG